jgi:hypothetical protein
VRGFNFRRAYSFPPLTGWAFSCKIPLLLTLETAYFGFVRAFRSAFLAGAPNQLLGTFRWQLTAVVLAECNLPSFVFRF